MRTRAQWDALEKAIVSKFLAAGVPPEKALRAGYAYAVKILGPRPVGLSALEFSTGILFRREKTMLSLRITLRKVAVMAAIVLLGGLITAAGSPEFAAAFADLPLGAQIAPILIPIVVEFFRTLRKRLAVYVAAKTAAKLAGTEPPKFLVP